MFKLFLFAAILAFASAAPGGAYLSALPAYTAYSSPISYSAPLAYSAYSAPSYAYSSHLALPYAYAAKPLAYAI